MNLSQPGSTSAFVGVETLVFGNERVLSYASGLNEYLANVNPRKGAPP